VTWCDHCHKPEPQLSDHHTKTRIEYLCGPCWRWAIYWDTLRPLKVQEKAA
jgi:hypothetical protein